MQHCGGDTLPRAGAAGAQQGLSPVQSPQLALPGAQMTAAANGNPHPFTAPYYAVLSASTD